MDVRQEIARNIGENGAVLRQFSSSLDAVSAEQMTQAIAEDCERVDAEW
jgi:hypothetical protein